MFWYIDSQTYTSGNESSSFPYSECLTTCYFPLTPHPQTEELEMTVSAACTSNLQKISNNIHPVQSPLHFLSLVMEQSVLFLLNCWFTTLFFIVLPWQIQTVPPFLYEI